MRTRTRITLAGVAAGAALIGGVAWATIPSDGGVYTACKLNATGTIRLIDPSLPSTSLLQHCTSIETQIAWNQKGQKGDAGPQGLTGPPGAKGTDGTNGTDGAAGAPGAACLPTDSACIGPKGDPGAKGDPCLPSDPACVGPKGDKGDAGTNGTEALWAVVGAGGIIVRSHGAILVPTRAPSAGAYLVEWGTGTPPSVVHTDISGCASFATLGGQSGGEISTEPGGDRTVVVTRTSAGVPIDHEFTVTVFC